MIILGSLERGNKLHISVNWTFFASCYGWGVTSEYWVQNQRFRSNRQRGPVDTKFLVEGVAPYNRFSSQKTRLNDLSYSVKIWTDLSSIFSQFTRLTDKRTDGQTFLPRCMECRRGLALRSLSVCLSVRPSIRVKNKKNKRESHIYCPIVHAVVCVIGQFCLHLWKGSLTHCTFCRLELARTIIRGSTATTYVVRQISSVRAALSFS